MGSAPTVPLPAMGRLLKRALIIMGLNITAFILGTQTLISSIPLPPWPPPTLPHIHRLGMFLVAEMQVLWVSREFRPHQVKQPASRCLLPRWWAVSLLLLVRLRRMTFRTSICTIASHFLVRRLILRQRFEASSPIGVHVEAYKAG